MTKQDRDAIEMRGPWILGKESDEFVGQAVRVDNNPLDTRGGDAGQGELAQRHSADRNEGFRNLVCQRLEPLSPAGAEKERRADSRTHAEAPGSSNRRMIIISDAIKPWRW